MAETENHILWNPDAPGQRKKLARYVLEGHADIARIFHEAKADLKELTGDPSFFGYISCEKISERGRRVRLEVKAIYGRLQKGKPSAGGNDLTYVLEPTESVSGRQRVRLAPEVLFWGHGVCLDWVLLYAACLKHAHIHPLIIIATDHALLGYWVDEEDAKNNSKIVLESAEIMPHVKGGRIKVINATRIPPDEKGRHMQFEKAEREAKTHLENVSYAVDIRAARQAGIEQLLPSLRSYDEDDIVPQSREFFRHDSFTERPLWAAHVADFLSDVRKKLGYLLFVAGEGEGKSAFIADFVRNKITQPVFHFVRRIEPGWDDPEQILRSLTAQLLQKHGVDVNPRLRERQMSARSDDERIKVAADIFADVVERVSRVLTADSEHEVFVVDGLDEAFGPTGRYYDMPGLPGLLPAVLPPRIYGILTSRPGDHLHWLRDTNLCEQYRLEDERETNIADVQRYFTEHANEVNPPLDASFIHRAAEKTQGNFYIAVHKLADIKRDPTANRNPEVIPARVKEYHAEVFTRVTERGRQRGVAERQIRFILGMMAEAREPLTLEVLDAFKAPDHAEQILRWAADYFRPRSPRRTPQLPFEFNHTSVIEFLSEQLTPSERRAIHEWLATACLNWRDFVGHARHYALRYLVTHLIEASKEV